MRIKIEAEIELDLLHPEEAEAVVKDMVNMGEIWAVKEAKVISTTHKER